MIINQPTNNVTRTEILEMNLAQGLDIVDQYPLFLVFIDLQKVYDTVDCGLLMNTLEGCSSGPHMCRFLAVFWYQQEVFTLQNRYHGPHFKATRGFNQGILISPTLFNLTVDHLVHKWLALTVDDQLVAQ